MFYSLQMGFLKLSGIVCTCLAFSFFFLRFMVQDLKFDL